MGDRVKKDLENQEVSGCPQDFWSEVTGFIFGFGFNSRC